MRSKETVSYNMSRIRSQGTKLENKLETILIEVNPDYVKHPKMFGKPDFAYLTAKIAIFADSDFWHGYDWVHKKNELKTNTDFWVKKIEGNISRDNLVTEKLSEEGWLVLRFWGHDINKDPQKCRDLILAALEERAASGK